MRFSGFCIDPALVISSVCVNSDHYGFTPPIHPSFSPQMNTPAAVYPFFIRPPSLVNHFLTLLSSPHYHRSSSPIQNLVRPFLFTGTINNKQTYMYMYSADHRLSEPSYNTRLHEFLKVKLPAIVAIVNERGLSQKGLLDFNRTVGQHFCYSKVQTQVVYSLLMVILFKVTHALIIMGSLLSFENSIVECGYLLIGPPEWVS